MNNKKAVRETELPTSYIKGILVVVLS